MSKKFLLSLTVASMFFTSCQTELEKKAFSSLRPSLLNPKSYDLISLEETRDLYYFDNIKGAKDYHADGMHETANIIDSLLIESNKYADDYMYIETLDLLFRSLSVDSAMTEFLEREENIKLSDFSIGKEYAYRFHAENEHGEVAPHLWYLYTDSADSICRVGAEKLDPIIFEAIPGYTDTLDFWIKRFSE